MQSHKKSVSLARVVARLPAAPCLSAILVFHFDGYAAVPKYELDASFTPTFTTWGYAGSAVPLRNGQLMASGYFSVVNGTVHNGLVRLNADGTVEVYTEIEGQELFTKRSRYWNDRKFILKKVDKKWRIIATWHYENCQG